MLSLDSLDVSTLEGFLEGVELGLTRFALSVRRLPCRRSLPSGLLSLVSTSGLPRCVASTSSLRFLSSAANCSASLTALSISSLLMLVEAVMVIFCSLPVPRSFADTLTIPLASISKVTSICGIPRGAGAMPSRRKRTECTCYPLRHLTLALEDVDINARLVVGSRWRISGSSWWEWWCCAR